MRPSRMTRLIQCEVNDLEHTEFGHTPLFSGACAHFGNGHVCNPKHFIKVFFEGLKVHFFYIHATSVLLVL